MVFLDGDKTVFPVFFIKLIPIYGKILRKISEPWLFEKNIYGTLSLFLAGKNSNKFTISLVLMPK